MLAGAAVMHAVIVDLPITDRALLQAEAELRWYFQSSEGAMGLRSMFYATLFYSTDDIGGRSYEIPDRALEAAERERHIRRTLERLPVHHRLVLRCYATSTRGMEAFGPLGNVAALTATARDTYWRTPSAGGRVFGATAPTDAAIDIAHQSAPIHGRDRGPGGRRKPKPPFLVWLRRLSDRVTTEQSHNLAADRALVRRINFEAQEMLVGALSAYDQARGRRR